jgi:hypothetical protein
VPHGGGVSRAAFRCLTPCLSVGLVFSCCWSRHKPGLLAGPKPAPLVEPLRVWTFRLDEGELSPVDAREILDGREPRLSIWVLEVS